MAPDIAIVGVPKAGTSSVHSWLAGFPEVSDSKPKETFFFIDSDNPMKNQKCNFHQHGSQAYASFFVNSGDGLLLDSTTHYLFQDTARNTFADGQTKVLAIIRDPVKRIISYFQYLAITKSTTKRSLSFDAYVDCLLSGDAETLRGYFYEEKHFYALAMALEHGKYSDYLSKWTQQFSDDRFKVVLFEHLVAEREATLLSISEHFGLQPTDEQLSTLPRDNKTVGIRSARLNRLARTFGKLVPGESFRENLRKMYLKIQSREIPDFTVEHSQSILRLAEFFEPENKKLADKFALDISRWTTVKSLSATTPPQNVN